MANLGERKMRITTRNSVDENSIPIYFKLQTLLKEEIENGRWEPGQSIPTERTLAETHKVSIGTVKKAISGLVNQGYVYRIQGKGTFVAGTMLLRENLRYNLLLTDFGDKAAGLKVRLMEKNLIEGFEPVNHYLKIRINQGLYELKRLFILGEKPIVYAISYLPEKMFENLSERPASYFEECALYEALERSYGLPTIYNHELFGVVQADGEAAKRLQVPNGTPLQYIEMLSFTYKEKPYEYRKTFCMTDQRKVFRIIR
jgi:GntR family transcriptional regulator